MSSSSSGQVRLDQLIRGAQQDFIKLCLKTDSLVDKYKRGYGDEDGRPEFFMQCYLLNVWLLTQFDNFLEILDRRNNRVTRYIDLTGQDRKQFVLQYDRINRASYCTAAMFNVEIFLKRIIDNLPGNNKTHGYRNITENLRKSLGLTPYQRDVLNVLARVRNALHDDGYHRKPDHTVVIRGISYNFVNGQKIGLAGWNHLYIMSDELLDVIINSIIDTPQVEKLTIPHTSETYHDNQ
jgi:hypothetical protein